MHIVNQNWIFTTLFTICKPWMSDELLALFTIHSDLDSLAAVVPRELLPKPLGGDVELRSYDHQQLIDMDTQLRDLYNAFPAALDKNANVTESANSTDSNSDDVSENVIS